MHAQCQSSCHPPPALATRLLTHLLLLPARRELGGSAIGVRAGSGLMEGAACEFVLGSLLTFVVLYAGEFKSRWVQEGSGVHRRAGWLTGAGWRGLHL
jgi:hypothetical protein